MVQELHRLFVCAALVNWKVQKVISMILTGTSSEGVSTQAISSIPGRMQHVRHHVVQGVLATQEKRFIQKGERLL